MSLQYNGKEWVSVFDCHLCKTPITDSDKWSIIPMEYYDSSGKKGYMFVDVCKECHREQQLNKLIK
jgi:hypothetical protein